MQYTNIKKEPQKDIDIYLPQSDPRQQAGSVNKNNINNIKAGFNLLICRLLILNLELKNLIKIKK